MCLHETHALSNEELRWNSNGFSSQFPDHPIGASVFDSDARPEDVSVAVTLEPQKTSFRFVNEDRRLLHQRARNCEAIIRVLFFSRDRKSTRLNSSHANISYAVFCL